MTTVITATTAGCPGPVLESIDTTALPPAQRYEYWTSTQLRHIRADPPSTPQRRDFRSRLLLLATRSRKLHYSASDGFVGTRTRRDMAEDPSDQLYLLYVIEGRIATRLRGDEEVVAQAGEFFLYDPTTPQRLAMSRHRVVQIDFSRGELAAACGGRAPASATLCDALGASRLAPLLRAHIERIPDAAPTLGAGEQAALLEATHHFALLTLQGVFIDPRRGVQAHRLGHLAAARRYIQANLDKPDLSPAEVARAVGCSRATLYRVFEQAGESVAGHIREQRLQRLHALLRNRHDSRPVWVLAQRCGLYDTANLGQMFRRRFGLTPSEARAQARQCAGETDTWRL